MRFIITLLLLSLALTACAAPASAPITQITPPTTPRAPDAPPAPYRIVTVEEGVYRLDPTTLARIGFADIPPERLHLTHAGEPWPFAYTQDGLLFYAPALRSRYTQQNVFLLSAGDSPARQLTPEALPAPQGETVDSILTTLHLEENLLYEPKVKQGDHWLWQKLIAPGNIALDLPLDEVQPGSGTLTVTVWANTGRTIPTEDGFDHHWRASINGQTLLDETWNGEGEHTLSAEIPAGLLQPQDNRLTLESLADGGLIVDIVSLDAVEVTYPQRASATAFAFRPQDDSTLQVEGLKGTLYLWDVSDPQAARLFQGDAGTPFGVAANHRYFAHTQKGARSPLSLEPAVYSPDLRATSGAEYLLIGAPPLLEAAQPLVEHRSAQGLKVLSIPLQAVYDQFSDGLVTPEAIRALLQYGTQSWETPPRYVLLLGDYTYDTYGYQTTLDYPLPSFMVYTAFGGETVSDVLMAQLDDDLQPDIAIGRLPAQTPQQVQTYVQKVLSYESQATEEWQQRVLAIADGQEAYFADDARAFLNFFDTYQTTLYAPPADAPDASQAVDEYFTQGNLLVAYFGHGSLNQWGKDRIFTAEEASALKNAERLPIVVNMTCLTGLFTHPKVTSLAETLLFAPDGGAIAMLAPTSLTLASDQSALSIPFAQALLEAPDHPLGDAFLKAQRQVPTEQSGTRDVLETFLLFGDPALIVK